MPNQLQVGDFVKIKPGPRAVVQMNGVFHDLSNRIAKIYSSTTLDAGQTGYYTVALEEAWLGNFYEWDLEFFDEYKHAVAAYGEDYFA